jgi:DNA-binding beta-propeller fold protein YncE
MIYWPALSRAAALAFALIGTLLTVSASTPQEGRFLYVATPGIRNYLEYGGHGVLVYDIDHGHEFVRRIPFAGLDPQGKPLNVKGICASAATGRLYVSTLQSLICIDLNTDQVLWEKSYDTGCDRMSITPDGKTIYLPSLEKETWHVVDATDGHVITELTLNSRAHNTIVGPDGREAYLAGLGSPLLAVADVSSNRVVRKIGPFGSAIRPFTINGRQTRAYVNVNELLGFEIGDLQTGQVLERVEVAGFSKGPTKRHGCPSHGIALTLDEKELWLADAANSRIHLFDLTAKHPKQVASIELRDQPGWITFGIDGQLVYPSTGEIIDVRTRKIIATLKDEKGGPVQSEKLLEIDFKAGRPVVAGNQFAIGGLR